LFDTGCTKTTFRSKFLQDAGAIASTAEAESVATASGNFSAKTYVLHDLHALGSSSGPITVLGMDLPTDIEQDGMLGMDFLSKLKMTIDFPLGTIRMLKPTKPRKRRK
jgi:predicted aspartyl protease